MKKHFVSEPVTPLEVVAVQSLPSGFRWREETLPVGKVLNVWRSTKTDRGEDYLKREWYEFETSGERIAIVYFDRGARPGKPRWWLYAISSL